MDTEHQCLKNQFNNVILLMTGMVLLTLDLSMGLDIILELNQVLIIFLLIIQFKMEGHITMLLLRMIMGLLILVQVYHPLKIMLSLS